MGRFKKGYFFVGLLVFFIEVWIALFVKDAIIRPHIGDVLVVIMIYCFIRAFVNWPVNTAAIITLVFSYMIEALQYFKIVEVLGLQKYAVARIVIGTYFSWIDIIAYTAGFVIILVVEKIRLKRQEGLHGIK